MTRRETFFESGVQYGHKLCAWNPRMKPFIWGKKDSIYIINLAITDKQLSRAEMLLEDIASQGKQILWVGTKKIARDIIRKCATDTASPFFADRWVGGTITNHSEVKKAVTNMLYDIEIFEKADRSVYTKKELNTLRKRIDRAKKNVGGIEKLSWPIGALVVADVMKDAVAVREAIETGIPVIALVDTNCDPRGIDVVIPANDDLESSISIIFQYLAQAVARGKEAFSKREPAPQDVSQKDRSQNQQQKRPYENNRSFDRSNDRNNDRNNNRRDSAQSSNKNDNHANKDRNNSQHQQHFVKKQPHANTAAPSSATASSSVVKENVRTSEKVFVKAPAVNKVVAEVEKSIPVSKVVIDDSPVNDVVKTVEKETVKAEKKPAIKKTTKAVEDAKEESVTEKKTAAKKSSVASESKKKTSSAAGATKSKKSAK